VKDAVEAEKPTETTETSEASGENVRDEVAEAKEEGAALQPTVADDGTWQSEGLVFTTVDIDGNAVSESIIKDSKVVLVNLWEPWCGPCVREIPDLEKLYENYKDQGLLILGVYTTFEMDADAKENLYSYEQDYVPATFLFDGNGKLLESEPIAGAQSYEQWESVVLQYLSE
jgi:thiol-disulfide isomerase/thioredoxin